MKHVCMFTLLCMLTVQVPARAADVIDRIIVVVNSTPVLLSEWDEAWRCEALLAGRKPESYSRAEQQDMFKRLVNQELLRQQMRSYLLTPVSEEDLQARVKEVRTQLGVMDNGKWKASLAEAGVTQDELRYHLRRQMELERFIDVRFRPGIRVEDREVARYYYNEFLPKLHEAGGKDVPLNEVSGKIRQILVQQQIEEQLSSWLESLREEAEIRTPEPISSDSNTIDLVQSK